MIRVSRLSIAPVRSLGLQHPRSIELTPDGVAEDRRFYLVDRNGRLVDRLIAGGLARVQAWTDPDATRLQLTFPSGEVIDDEVRLGEPIETNVHKRLGSGHIVEGPWADALEPYAGRPVRIVRCDRPGGTRIPVGWDHVRNGVSLISDGSIRALAAQLGVASLDARRFRMLIEVEGAEAHEEDDWIGGQVEIGSAVLRITKPDARCAITTQDPDTGIRDLDTLRGIIAYRGLRDGRHADLGVLGEVAVPGRIAVGDAVAVVDAEVRVPA
ncbi:MAG: MOSC domain-containing protein [Chloroflexi bacterium]|nr:MOSC domain-containing protein [Chloroflexota bacterium]